MKKFTFLLSILLLSFGSMAQVSINADGSDPDRSAMLDIKSTSEGFLPPRMTEAQRNAISGTVEGLVVWCTNCGAKGELQVYNGTSWINMSGIESYTQAVIDTIGIYDGLIVHNATTNCINYYYQYSWFEACGTCTPTPSHADAGDDQTFNNELVSTTLAGNTPDVGTGLWTVKNGVEGGIFVDSLDPETTFSGKPCTDYTLAWTISTSCGSTTDTVVVSFFSIPTVADAGTDTIVPGGSTAFKLYANRPAMGRGQWTILKGEGGTIYDSSNPTSLFGGKIGTKYTLQWAISTICGPSTDKMTVVFKGLQIGQSYQGGIIAYILRSGDPGYVKGRQNGIIAAPTDQNHGDKTTWGCHGRGITGARATALGTGLQNTFAIVADCNTSGIAARICEQLILNGYKDWYLPSKDELNKLYQNKDKIGKFKTSNADYYWSSSEYNKKHEYLAYNQCFANGNQNSGQKNGYSRVRAVRSFSYVPSYCGYLYTDDRDGNKYETEQIGSQCWMKENLMATMYRKYISIPNVTDSSSWKNLTTGAYVWYENDISWKDKYGALYNWYAIANTVGLCPPGWHMPTNNEWTELTNFIGGTDSPLGNKLKSCRQVNYSPDIAGCTTTVHPRWDASPQKGTDDYGFSALPGGIRDIAGIFNFIGSGGGWWTSTDDKSTYVGSRYLDYNSGTVVEEWKPSKQTGLSVRCLKD